MNLRTNFVVVLIGTCALLSAQCVQAQFSTPTFYIGINCILPAIAVRPIPVRAGAPITLLGYACGTTPPANEANLTFGSSDPRASLPPRFRFLPGAGVDMGSAVLHTVGVQFITATDAANRISSTVPFLVTIDPPTVPTLSVTHRLALIAFCAITGGLAARVRARRLSHRTYRTVVAET